VRVEAFRGQRGPFENGLGRGWDSTGVAGAMGGAGIEPWPAEALHVDTGLLDTPAFATRAFSTVAANRVYIGLGRRLYRTVELTDPSWASLVPVADMGAGNLITGVATVGDNVVCMVGAGTDAKRYNPWTGALSTWRGGERATRGVGYAGQLVYAPRTPASGATLASLERLKLSLDAWSGAPATDERWLDAPIVEMGLFAGKVAVATRSSLWLVGGQPDPGAPDDPNTTGDQSRPTRWRGDPEPVFSHGAWTAEDDFVFLASLGGRLYTWLAGACRSWTGGVDGWQATPLEGTACYGACVAAGWLVVAIRTRAGVSEVWATDGGGDSWWRIARDAGSGVRMWPVALNGAGNRDLLVFRADSTTYDLHRLVRRTPALHSYRASAEWVSPLLDAGDRAARKAWPEIGATFAAPEPRGDPSSADALTVSLSYSTDAGATWTAAASQSLAGGGTRLAHLAASLPDVASRWLQLKVTWDGVLDWAPTLVAAWADALPLATSPGRRRWKLAIRCGDRQPAPDGSPLPRTGRQLSAALWDAWTANAVVSFGDADRAATGVTHQVRIVSLEERMEVPADAGRWGESVATVEVVEA